MNVRIYGFVPMTEVEGPGRRACLWVQGCTIRCPGCFNPHTWPTSGGRELSVDEIVDATTAADGIEGITFLGGEPFEQAAPLAAIGMRLRAAGLSVMTFTGYEFETLREARRRDWDDLLEATDLLVDGPFVASLPDRFRPWVGSTNQRFLFLTPRYRHLEAQLATVPDRLEVRLRPDGSVWINGMVAYKALRALERDLGLRVGAA